MDLFTKKSKALFAALATLLLWSSIVKDTKAQIGLELEDDTLTKSVLVHPVIETGENEHLYSREHTYRSQLQLSDQLARDFLVTTSNNEGIIQLYKNDGKANKDYFGWKKNVLAPFDAKVTRVNESDSTNKPGVMNRDVLPGLIFFEKENGLTVIYAHAREIKVQKGEQVQAGEVVAKVGNNGNSIGPHIHVGAWKNGTPLQIQVDLYAEERSK